MNEFSYVNKFNDTLFGNQWIIDSPKAIIVLVTGMAEHSGRYDDWATYMNNHGYNVYCLDHYGQGKNGVLGQPGKDYFAKMIETLKDFIKTKKEEFLGLPVYMFAHSMGTFVTQGFLEKYSNNVDKIVLCGSNYKNGFVSKSGYMVAKMIVNKKNYNKQAGLLYKLSIGAYEKTSTVASPNGWISFNEDNVKKYDEDPLSGFPCSNGFYLEFFKGLSTIHNKKLLKKVNPNLKVFIIGGDNDPVGANGKELRILHKVYTKCGINNELKIYVDMRHEILNETNREKVYHDVLDFFDK